MPTDHTKTSIPPAAEAPQLPRPLQLYRLQPTPPSQSPQMPFYHQKGVWDTLRTLKEDGKDQPTPAEPLWTEALVRRLVLRSVGSAERNHTAARADLQHLTVYLKPRALSSPLRCHRTEGRQASHRLFCALVSPAVTRWLRQRGKLHKTVRLRSNIALAAPTPQQHPARARCCSL